MTDALPAPDSIAAALASCRYADAAALLEAWLADHPGDADAWFNLGVARRQLLEVDAALTAYGRALAAGIAAPEHVHLNMAAIHAEVLQDVAAARASLQAALALQPDFLLAWLNLGQLEEDAGDAGAARAAYEAAVAADPAAGRAHARLAMIDLHEGRPAAALARLDAAGAHVADADGLVEIAFASANALDAAGAHAAALDRADAANRLQQRQVPRHRRHGASAARADAIIRLFAAAGAAPPASAATIAPIFICGLFRSGSTLLESLMHRRLGLTMGGELAFTPWFMAAHGASLAPENLDALAGRYAAGYAAFVGRVLGPAVAAGAPFTDKRLDNYGSLGLMKRAFPAAPIIHMMRRPIDNFLSLYFLPFADGIDYANDFDDMLDHYRQYRRLMAHWQQLFGADIVTVRYEQLVADPETVLNTLAARLGLAPAELAPVAPAIIRTASVWQVRAPIHGASAGRWRRHADQIGELAALLDREFPEFADPKNRLHF